MRYRAGKKHIDDKSDKQTVSINDYPLNSDKLNRMKKFLGTNNINLHCINIDERGMVGQGLLAWMSSRMAYVTGLLLNRDIPLTEIPAFGYIPIVNLCGDHFQLGPIGDFSLISAPPSHSSPVQRYGFAVYQIIERVIILDEIMRQKPSQQDFITLLNHVRLGEITQCDWETINSRSIHNLTENEKEIFAGQRSITLTETWSVANDYNYNAIMKINTPVAVIVSEGKGYHHKKESDMGQIPTVCVICVGQRVMLTKNQEELLTQGLNNGAVGTVRTIYYAAGERPPSLPQYFVVEFPDYHGPVSIPGYPKFVPLSPDVGYCEDYCCMRRGIPLIPAYAISICKSQGMNIGEGRTIEKCKIHLSDDIRMETLNLGLTYTALSRVSEFTDIALANAIPFSRLECINVNKGMAGRKKEMERLEKLQVATLRNITCTVSDYIDLLRKIDEVCDDNIRDGICDNDPNKCLCVQHQSS